MDARARRALFGTMVAASACGGTGAGCPNLARIEILGRGHVDVELGDGGRACEGPDSERLRGGLGYSTEGGLRLTASLEAECGRAAGETVESVPAATEFVGWIRNGDCGTFSDASSIVLADDDVTVLAHFEAARTLTSVVQSGLEVVRAPIVVGTGGAKPPFEATGDLPCPEWQVRRDAEPCAGGGAACEMTALLGLPLGLAVSGVGSNARAVWNCSTDVRPIFGDGFVVDEGLVADRVAMTPTAPVTCSVRTISATRLEDTVRVRWTIDGDGAVTSSLGAPCFDEPNCQRVEREAVTTLTALAIDDDHAPGTWTCPARPAVRSDRIAVSADADTRCRHEMQVGVDIRVFGPARPRIIAGGDAMPLGARPVYVPPGTEVRIEVSHAADRSLRVGDCPLTGSQTLHGFRSDPVRVVEPLRCDLVVE